MGAVISTSLMVPLFFASSLDMIGGIMVAMYFLIIMRVFMILSGLDAGTSFGGMGSSREAMISALTEPIILLCLFTSAIITNTMYLGAISATLASNPTMMLEPSLFLAFFAFFIATLAENARVPFDNPATHLELTMVHEAMLIEYSGKQLGLMEYSSWIKHLIFFSILANAFFPLGIAVDLSLTSILVGIGAYLIKIFVIALIVAFIESSIAKLRLFQVPNLLGIGFALALMAILLLHIL
jgi:formate hydrogenlyase subunit 4